MGDDKIVCCAPGQEPVELPGAALDFIKVIADNWAKISALIPILMSIIQMFAKKDTPAVS